MSGQDKPTKPANLDRPVLIVSWVADEAAPGESATAYLNRSLGNQLFHRIDPEDFFELDGVVIERNIIQFPEPVFSSGSRNDVIVFRSPPPRFDWYRFLTRVLEVADVCNVREIYALGAMTSLISHSSPRDIMANYTTTQLRDELIIYNLGGTWNYETPPGQRPTLNSYLLWLAKKRNIPAATLWVPVPFYLTSGDPKAELRLLDFIDRRLGLSLDLGEIRERITQQDRLIAKARTEHPEIDSYLSLVERGEPLPPEDGQALVSFFQKTL